MDRKKYKLPFREKYTPQWVCPTCNSGVLTIKKNTFHKEETSKSITSQNRRDWDPEQITYVYSCLLICSNSGCKETVANSGIGFVHMDVDFDEDDRPFQIWEDFFSPKYFTPHLKLISLDNDIPKDVSEEIDKSFELYFSDPASASTHIRKALENLLTYLKVKKYDKKEGKLTFLSLHRRIDLIPKKYSHLKELFFAVKWLGNAGSHSDKKITEDDVMDAYEIMEEIVNELFIKKSKHIKKLVKEINKKKGPKN